MMQSGGCDYPFIGFVELLNVVKHSGSRLVKEVILNKVYLYLEDFNLSKFRASRGSGERVR